MHFRMSCFLINTSVVPLNPNINTIEGWVQRAVTAQKLAERAQQFWLEAKEEKTYSTTTNTAGNNGFDQKPAALQPTRTNIKCSPITKQKIITLILQYT